MEVVSIFYTHASSAHAVKSYGIYLVIEAFYLVFIWFGFPETRHRTIEEVSVLFDHQAAIRKSKLGSSGQDVPSDGFDFQAKKPWLPSTRTRSTMPSRRNTMSTRCDQRELTPFFKGLLPVMRVGTECTAWYLRV